MVSKQGEGVSFMKALEQVRDATKNVSKSKVDVILNELEETNTEMYEELREALGDISYSASNIAKTLKNFGFDISDSSVKRWRQIHNG
tara:strand:- start:453 stop:716 length:264 start_codon:yes stop_codon:yes gene_type:complete